MCITLGQLVSAFVALAVINTVYFIALYLHIQWRTPPIEGLARDAGEA